MKILIVAATAQEITPLIHTLGINEPVLHVPSVTTLPADILITGPGMAATAYSLGRWLRKEDYSLVINAGIAGSFSDKYQIGSVVQVKSDAFADLGAEDNDNFLDLFELGLAKENDKVFKDGRIYPLEFYDDLTGYLLKADAITVNKAHGKAESIDKIISKYNPDIESMEGASVFYAANLEGIPSIQIRAISNKVEPRDRDKWNIAVAVSALNEALLKFLKKIS